MDEATRQFRLTSLIISVGDVKRVRRDLETIDDFLRQAALRTGGKPVDMPRAGRLLETLAREAGANLLQPADRQRLAEFLEVLLTTAPVLHFSFAAEPSAAFLARIVGWVRESISPQALVSIGLQPSIAVGCIVRTTNRQFDFSLAAAFASHYDLLFDSLRAPITDQARLPA